jgi:PEP-CTERM motif
MKYKLLAGSVLAALSAVSGAAEIVLDDFGLAQSEARVTGVGPAVTTTLLNPGGGFTKRDITNKVDSGTRSSSALVEGGIFSISNDVGVASTTTVSWTLDLSKIAAAIGSASFLEVAIISTGIDQGGVNVSAAGSAVRTFNAPGRFVLYSGAAVANPFTVTFASAAAVDSTWDAVVLAYTCTGTTITDAQRGAGAGSAKCGTAAVPVPGSVALLGLGLLGLAALRRKA